jgi:hypothetical protein
MSTTASTTHRRKISTMTNHHRCRNDTASLLHSNNRVQSPNQSNGSDGVCDLLATTTMTKNPIIPAGTTTTTTTDSRPTRGPTQPAVTPGRTIYRIGWGVYFASSLMAISLGVMDNHAGRYASNHDGD